MNVLEARRRMLDAEVCKKTASGNPVNVGSLARTRPGLKVFGRSEQFTTTGAQLLNIPKIVTTDSFGITVSAQGSEISFSGTRNAETGGRPNIIIEVQLDPGEYCASLTNSDNIEIRFMTSGGQSDGIHGNTYTVVGDEDAVAVQILISRISEGETINATTKAMLNLGSTAKPWEPCTGGEASPNPDYPQEVVSAGDDGSIQVDVGGRNIFDINQCVRFAQNTYGLKVEAQGDYFVISGTISVGKPEDSKVRLFQMCSYPEDLTGKHFITYVEESENIDPEYKWYVYCDKGDFDINIGLKYVQNNTYTYLKFKLMVTDEPGTFPYEPYKQPQTITIQTPNGLPGIPALSRGNYTDESGQQWICDEIDFKRGKYVQRVGSVLADGVVNKFTASGGGTFWNLNTDHSAPGVFSGKLYFSIYFARDFFGANEAGGFIYTLSEKGQKYFNTVDDLNAFCVEKNAEGNPLIIYYPMDPIETDLSEEQMEAYDSLHTNRPTTVVTATDDAGLELTYKTKKSLEVTT